MHSGGGACAQCAAAGATKRCGECRGEAYCSAQCQRQHWPVHKAACFVVSAAVSLDLCML